MAGLNLLAAIIIYWNTKHLSHAVNARKRSGLDYSPDLLSHISSLGSAHILFTGEYGRKIDNTPLCGVILHSAGTELSQLIERRVRPTMWAQKTVARILREWPRR